MDLNRRQLKMIVANVLAYAIHRTSVPLDAWTNDMCKRHFGRSKNFFFNKGLGFIETAANGKRELKQESFDLLCKSTGVRSYDLNSRIVDMTSYNFDPQAALDFADHFESKRRGERVYSPQRQ